MQNWQKERNYRKYTREDGSIFRVIMVDGIDVEVSEEIYLAYSQADRRERYLVERDAGRVLSLDRFMEEGFPLSRGSSMKGSQLPTLHNISGEGI